MISKLQSLKDNQGFMRYFKNTSWLFLEKILRIIASIFIGIWLARYLGPEQFGLFSYAQSFVGLFSVIATLGLDEVVIRELVKNKIRRNILISTVFWLKILGAIIVLFILLIATNMTSNDRYTNILIFIIGSSVVFKSFNVIDIFFQSQVMSKYVVYSNMVSLFLSSLIKIILILNNAPLIAFAWVVLFDSFTLACGFIYFFIKHPEKLNMNKFILKKELAFLLLKDSWPLILSGVLIAIYMKIDQVMIKEMLGSVAVGQYAAAAKLSEAWYFIPMVVASSLFPAIINAKKISIDLYYSRLQKLYTLMVWMAIAIALPMTFLSDEAVNILYGNQYNQAGGVLMIHIWTGIFVFLGIAFNKFLISENLTKKALYRTLLGATVNVFLNYILIPIYGIEGAAIATFFGQFSANYLYDIFDRSLHHQLKMKTMSFYPLYQRTLR